MFPHAARHAVLGFISPKSDFLMLHSASPLLDCGSYLYRYVIVVTIYITHKHSDIQILRPQFQLFRAENKQLKSQLEAERKRVTSLEAKLVSAEAANRSLTTRVAAYSET